MKKKIFVYSSAKPHIHDSLPMYVNTVPMSKDGLKKHFVKVEEPSKADFFYMGQFSNDNGQLRQIRPEQFAYFSGNEHKHICDIEGEGGFEASNRDAIPSWLFKSCITTMGPLKTYSDISKLFVRPTFSHLLIDIVKNRNETFEIPKNKSLGFRGFINHKMRAMTLHAVHNSDFKKEIHVNRKWSGPSEIGGEVQENYIQTMKNNLLSLCPRGSGIDSVRLIESCYYTRVPILISDYDYYLVGEEDKDLDFVFRITGEDLNPSKLADQLRVIYDTPINELVDRAIAARSYFDSVIRSYFNDPTAYFLKWLEKRE